MDLEDPAARSNLPRLARRSQRACYLPWLKISVALRYVLTYPWAPEAWREVRQHIPWLLAKQSGIRRAGSVWLRGAVMKRGTLMVAAICCLPAILLLLTSCASSGSHAGGDTFFIYRTETGQEVLTARAPRSSDPRGKPTPTATVTNNPTDEEFWQFEARVKVRALIGIPYGREPVDYNVIGSRGTCEGVRARVTDPTESCKGPFYFRRDAQ